MGRRVHHWTDEHDAALLQAIQDCGPLFAHYPEQGKTYSESDVWHAVAGRLLPGVVVTGKAARRRWEVMQERDAERRAEAAAQAPPANDAWDRCAQMVDDYERSIHECNADDLAALRSDIADIRRVVIAIGRELGVAAGGEDDDDACPDCRDEIPARCEVCGGCGGLPHGPCSHCNGSSIEPCPTCGGWDGLEPEWWRG